jgi:phage-related protein/ribosome-binding protein aMBF1 (putative translation factor)
LNGEFTIEYVELPNGRVPAREYVDSLDDKAAARIDAFIDRLRISGNRMQGKFVKKLTGDIFELRVKQFDRIFWVLFFYQPGMLIVITSGFQKKTQDTPPGEITRAEQLKKLWMKYRNRYTGSQKEREAILKGVGPMRQTVKRDKHSEVVEERARKSATYRKTFGRTLHQIDLALLVREMREDAGLTQAELAKKVGTTQSVIARLEDAEYTGHSLTMLERIAAVCGIALKLHAEKKPNFDREVALV